MPNIFKSFRRPSFQDYVFPEADELVVEPDPPKPEEPPPEPPPEEAPEAEPSGQEEPQSGAAALISYARVQADEIIADARRQGEQLIADRLQEAEQEIEADREAAREEGRRQGYADGLAQARQEAAESLRQQLQQEADQFRQFLEGLSAQREALMETARGELCELSLAVAEKVIHISLRSSREVVARMIQVATEKLKRREWVHVYVGGCEARELAQITPELTAALSGVSDHIKIIPMSDGEEGACIIEMPDEIIDASASTQLNNLRDLLRES